jgi:hypothetical protein
LFVTQILIPFSDFEIAFKLLEKKNKIKQQKILSPERY